MTIGSMLDAVDIEWLCDKITDGDSQRSIARELGCSLGTLINWIAKDADRSARVREARLSSARAFADKAEQVLTNAEDPFGLAKARELASHYRWQASKTNPREFGDKVELSGDPERPLTVTKVELVALK
jgi:hypothetical protein